MTRYLPGYSRSRGWSSENRRAGRNRAHSRPQEEWLTGESRNVTVKSFLWNIRGGKNQGNLYLYAGKPGVSPLDPPPTPLRWCPLGLKWKQAASGNMEEFKLPNFVLSPVNI